MSSSTTKQPKHRVSIPAKSALKTGPKGKQPAVAEDEPVSTAKRPTKGTKKAVKPRERIVEQEGLSDLSGAEGEDEFDLDVEEDRMEVDVDEDDEEGSSEEDGTDEEIEGMKADRKKSKKNTSQSYSMLLTVQSPFV